MPFQFQAPTNRYATTIAELLAAGPRAQADAVLQAAHAKARAQEMRGQGQANLIGAAFGTAGDLLRMPGQIKAQRQQEQVARSKEAQESQLQGLKIQQAQDSLTDAATARTDKTKAQQDEELSNMGYALFKFGHEADVVQRVIQDGVQRQLLAPEDAQRLSSLAPEAIVTEGAKLLAKSPNGRKLLEDTAKANQPKPPEPYTLNPGDVRYGAENQVVASVPVTPPKPEREPNPTEASLALLAAKGDQAAAKALALIRQQRPPDQGARPDYEWVTRDGKPVQVTKGAAQPGDMPYRPPSGTSETAQDRQRTARMEAARGFLTRLNELRDKINTKMGPAAGITGTVRRGVANIGWDPDVAEYERIRAAGGRSLAVAIMGAQNLSDADADAWAGMLPGATVDKETAKRLTDQVGRMLSTMDEPKPGGAVTPPATLGANTTQIVEQNGVRYKVTTDASGKVISSEVAR